MQFSIKDFFGKCDQIRSFLRIWSHILKKSLMENFLFCAVLRYKSGKETPDIPTNINNKKKTDDLILHPSHKNSKCNNYSRLANVERKVTKNRGTIVVLDYIQHFSFLLLQITELQGKTSNCSFNLTVNTYRSYLHLTAIAMLDT